MEELFTAVEADLRGLAKAQMAQERPGHTLQPTALIDDAFIRLVRVHNGAFANRRYFYVAAAEAMRRILIDHARARNAAKRGGGAKQASLTVSHAPSVPIAVDPLVINDELDSLVQHHHRAAEVVKLRVFAGLTHAQVADLLGVSERTARADWEYARAWLYARLHPDPPKPG